MYLTNTPTHFMEGSVTFLDSLQSYLKKSRIQIDAMRPEQRLSVLDQAKNCLYSYDAQIIGDVAKRILQSDLENDPDAQALMLAMYNHSMDPAFITVVMQYLAARNDPSLNGVVGAVLIKVLGQYYETHTPKDKDKKKDAQPEMDASEVRHIQGAVENLLGGMADLIVTTCGNMQHEEALAVAACLAMNNDQTIIELVNSNVPIKASIFDQILANPGGIIQGALLLKKADLPTKLSPVQTEFLNSLKEWLYDMLDKKPEGSLQLYNYLVAVYGSVKPDLSPYYIQLKDCGTRFTNLIQVAKQISN
ncbi:MAG: hypothetical protein J5614_08440 [Paludibacteraceae bacterium]|nr:hypothetical protein [Paludibacteraceae bacterium]